MVALVEVIVDALAGAALGFLGAAI